MITHYLPQWLLGKFRAETLYELDIFIGEIKPRKLISAGSKPDIWPADIEKVVMELHDNRAAQLYRKKIAEKHRIMLTDQERLVLATWLGLFWPRVPQALEDMEQLIEAEKGQPDSLIELVLRGKDEFLKHLQQTNPSLFSEVAEAVGLEAVETHVVELLSHYVGKNHLKLWPEPEQAYHTFLRKASLDDFAHLLCHYQWCWIRSPQGFVIGDNPLVRLHRGSGRWNAGIGRDDVEISIPLSANLTLILDRPLTGYTGHISNCTKEIGQRLNMRQRVASTKYVYSGDPELLKTVIAAPPKVIYGVNV